MTAAMSVPDGELWASFPEATRNDILGLLGMLLERWAVPAGLAAEGSGGEHGGHPATIRPPDHGPLMTAPPTGPTNLGAYWAQLVAVSRERP